METTYTVTTVTQHFMLEAYLKKTGRKFYNRGDSKSSLKMVGDCCCPQIRGKPPQNRWSLSNKSKVGERKELDNK